MLDKTIKVRLNSEDIEKINEAAKRSGISPTAMARIYIREGFSRYDWKHDFLVEKIEALKTALDQANLLAAMSVAAVSFLDAGRIDGKSESGQARVKAHIQASIKMGRVIKEMNEEGLLTKAA